MQELGLVVFDLFERNYIEFGNTIKARFFLLVDLQELFFGFRVGGTKINK